MLGGGFDVSEAVAMARGARVGRARRSKLAMGSGSSYVASRLLLHQCSMLASRLLQPPCSGLRFVSFRPTVADEEHRYLPRTLPWPQVAGGSLPLTLRVSALTAGPIGLEKWTNDFL